MGKISEFIRLNVLLPLAERIKGTKATYWYRQINRMSQWSRDEITQWQNEQLRRFVQHAYDHTKYYKNLFASLGLKPSDIQSAEDLKKLPIMTKADVRKHYNEIIPDDIDQIPHRQDRTGGTTGEPMDYLTDENVWGFVTASKIFAWEKLGYRYGDKFVALGSSSLFRQKPSLTRRIYDWIRQEIPMNAMNLSDELCEKYLKRIQKENIHYIYGYASSVFLLAKYALDHNLNVTCVKGAFTTSENLTEYYRTTIQAAFKCQIMDSYGARDAGITAYEVAKGKYIVSYDVIPEVVDTFDDNEGTLLSTCVINNAFPLMRYDFGDCVKIKEVDSIYNAAIFTKITGRIADVIRLDNGHTLTGPGFTILINKFVIKAFCIQKINGHCIKLQIQIDPDKWNDPEESRLQAEMNRFAGEGCEAVIEYVDHFEPLKNGKRRYFYNEG